MSMVGCTFDFEAPFAQSGSNTGGATTTSGSGGKTATGGGMASGGAGGGSASGEQCHNGIDDDDDSLVDCADPECTTSICAPPAPVGWDGPAPLSLGLGGPSCPAALTPLGSGTGAITATPASCNACDCTSPAGGDCDLGTTTIYDSSNSCGGPIEEILVPSAPNQCESFNMSDPQAQAESDVIDVDAPGSCTASGGEATLTNPSFAEPAELCTGSVGAGCSGDVCVPALDGAPICIFAAGNGDCPPGAYSDKTVLFESIADTRDCGPCSCGPATDQTCSGVTELFAGNNCQAFINSLPHDGTTCDSYDLSQPGSSYMFIPGGPPAGGSCATSGGEPIGAATAQGAITACCMP
jgi:hypothetical protein